MSNSVYPYRVSYPKTGDWYDSGGRWYQLSTWCKQMFGDTAWNYYGSSFVFEHERDYMLFRLKWT